MRCSPVISIRTLIYVPNYSGFPHKTQRNFSQSMKPSTTIPSDRNHEWFILNDLHEKRIFNSGKRHACLLLNVPTNASNLFSRFRFLWDTALLKVAVDSSANFLSHENIIHTAHVVCGDFDSIDPKLIESLKCPIDGPISSKLKNFREPDTKFPEVIETPDQDETDFTKAIEVVQTKKPDIDIVFAAYYFNGYRIDHFFGLINTLHKSSKTVVLLNIRSNTISWLLKPGSNLIYKPRGQENCSLVPFLGETFVKTEGLKFDLEGNKPLGFNRLISTSNSCLEDNTKITVVTDRKLLWSIDTNFMTS